MVYQIGILANAAFIEETRNGTYGDPGEAFASVQWMFGGLNSRQEERLHAYVQEHPAFRDGCWKFSYDKVVPRAVMWWEEEWRAVRRSKGMSRNYGRCPFSGTGCKECPIYRGRHCYIKGPHGEPPVPAPLQKDETDWIEGFNDFFDDLNEDLRKDIKFYESTIFYDGEDAGEPEK
jgi:hypothetical protein